LVRLRALRLFAFTLVALATVLGAEASQVLAESFLGAEEDRMVALVNDHRAQVGLGPLAHNDALRWVARRHARAMADAGSIYHNPNLAADADAAIPGWRAVGENVGVGPSTESVQQAFLDSPKHRDNIEGPRYTVVGLGAVSEPGGQHYFTQNFADWAVPPPPPPAPPAQAAAPPPPAAPPSAEPSAVREAVPPPTPATRVESEVEQTPQPGAGPGASAPASSDEDGSLFELLLTMLATFVRKIASWT
jgi:hypothetical protein